MRQSTRYGCSGEFSCSFMGQLYVKKTKVWIVIDLKILTQIIQGDVDELHLKTDLYLFVSY